MASKDNKKRVLFVCLGNICRSPIAEAVFQRSINQRGIADRWEVDSAAIGGWHAGKPPDPRTQDTLKKHNITYHGRARQIMTADFNTFDYIFAMDQDNLADLKDKAPQGAKAKIQLFGEYDPQGEKVIRDPYYDTDSEGFEKCYDQSVRCCNAFLDKFK